MFKRLDSVLSYTTVPVIYNMASVEEKENYVYKTISV
jgi:hypothetical protein